MRSATSVLVMMSVLVVAGLGQVQKTTPSSPKPTPTQISIKVGWAIGALRPQGPQLKQPPVDIINGATVALFDKNGKILSVGTTDEQGMFYGPYQEQNFVVSVLIVGRKMDEFRVKGGETTVLIRLEKDK